MIAFNYHIHIRITGHLYTVLLVMAMWKSLVYFLIEELP